MYWNIGGTIKKLAIIVGYGCTIISLLLGFKFLFRYLDNGWDENFLKLSIAFSSAFLFYINHFLVYGFGELIETTIQINNNIKSVPDNTKEN